MEEQAPAEYQNEASLLKAIEEDKNEEEKPEEKKEQKKEKEFPKEEFKFQFKKLPAFENKKVKIILLTDEITKITEKKKFFQIFVHFNKLLDFKKCLMWRF